MKFEPREAELELHDGAPDVQEMLLLASRLQESRGGQIDDETVIAVAEATGATPEYVRLVLGSAARSKKRGPLNGFREQYLALDPLVRRLALAGWQGTMAGIFSALGTVYGDRFSLLGIVTVVLVLSQLIACSRSRDKAQAAMSGMLFAGLWFVGNAAFLATLSLAVAVKATGSHEWMLVPYLIGGALVGGIAQQTLARYLAKVGLRNPSVERQELLKQLVEIQDRLRSGEQSAAFLSVDVVGSTRMKVLADPLAVEFTFTEYHRFVESIAVRYGGAVHSTAGDGITCAFQHPHQAFQAARTLQAGLFELNAHRNRLGTPIRLRAGIHYGNVNAPEGDLTNLSFAEVIDIAAHLQKACPEGGVAISDAAARVLPGGPSSVGESRVNVADTVGWVWQPKRRVELPGPQGGGSPAFDAG